MLTIGDAIAILGICIVAVAAIIRMNRGSFVSETECLLRNKNVCQQLSDIKKNINDLFSQLDDLNKYLRKS